MPNDKELRKGIEWLKTNLATADRYDPSKKHTDLEALLEVAELHLKGEIDLDEALKSLYLPECNAHLTGASNPEYKCAYCIGKAVRHQALSDVKSALAQWR